MDTPNIYTGVWTNYARGRVNGLTLTLTNAQATALVSFLAVLVTHTAARSFKITKFLLHQTRCHETPRDGLARQHDVLLRNAETDMGALPLVGWIAWKWRGHTPRPMWRSTILLLVLLVHTAGFLAAGVAVSLISEGDSSLVRAIGDECGAWVFKDKSIESVTWWQTQSLKGTTATKAYKRLCYETEDSGPDPSECKVFPRRRLDWTATHNASCPFGDGICLEGDTAAYTMDTGLRSSRELGINTNHEMQWQHRTTCSPLKTEGYTQVREDGQFGENVTYYLYGSVGGLSEETNSVSDWSRVGSWGYQLSLQTTTDWIGNGTSMLTPIPALKLGDADVTLLFLSAYGITYNEPIDDPFFSAHQKLAPFNMPGFDPMPIYRTDYPATVLGCTDQYRFCNPARGTCTPFLRALDFDLLIGPPVASTKAEEDVAALLLHHVLQMNIYTNSIGQGSQVLAITDHIYAGSAIGLAREQWKAEAAHVFEIGLASAQVEIVRLAKESYPHPRGPMMSYLPPEFQGICRMVLFRESGFTNISVVGLVVIVVMAGVMTAVSFLDGVVGKRMAQRWPHRVLAWRMDGVFWLLRLVNEERRIGTWGEGPGEVPTTNRGEMLGVLEVVGGKVVVVKTPSSIEMGRSRKLYGEEFGPGPYGGDIREL